MKLAIISLGCPKNQVDADVFCRALIEAGYETVASPEQADGVIVNTCGFIEAAKEEAIEVIFNCIRIKESKNDEYFVIVTGCLAQRYKNEICSLLPEVDSFVGINSNHLLPEIIRELKNKNHDKIYFHIKEPFSLNKKRIISTPAHYAWLKIAEGCSNSCSYCAIPAIRGPFRSRELNSCVEEASWLAEQGVKELILVAQDVTAYGTDLKNDTDLSVLLEQLDKVEGIEWIRLLYTYPEKINGKLLDVIASSKKVLPYFDIPIQHINDDILRSMRRKGGKRAILDSIELIKTKLPDAVLRTSLIAGYPGESEEQFNELCDFVKSGNFDKLGCFAYSPEEGTIAEKLPNQIDEEIRAERAARIMEIQAHVMDEKQRLKIGLEMEVICDGVSKEEGVWLCRSKGDAPEIDTYVYVKSDDIPVPGAIYKTRITDADVYDLYAELI